ncbi:MAG: hypothetical protein IJB75_01845 [Oscillospiraceae bacterium]|nr:hypothetical protein [Oscillospiraceae bacterium]
MVEWCNSGKGRDDVKKRQMFGILAIVLTVVACLLSYYRFWVALAGFGIAMVVLPVAFWLIDCRFAWFSMPFAVLLDLVSFWPEYCYYESRGLFLYVTLAQLTIMAVLVLLLMRRWFWGGIALGLVLFVGTIPFNHDMYIPQVFTAVCLCLNALSALLFAKLLHRVGTKGLNAERRAMFTVGVIAQAIGHGVFSIMNWGSWLFLGLSVIALAVLAVSHVNERKKCKD